MTRAYATKPLDERNLQNLTVPLPLAVVDALVKLAAARSMTKTELARRLIVDGMAALPLQDKTHVDSRLS